MFDLNTEIHSFVHRLHQLFASVFPGKTDDVLESGLASRFKKLCSA